MTDVYLAGFATASADTGSSGLSVPAMPTHSSGSFILAAWMHDSTSGGAWSTPSGYTQILNGTGGSCNGALFYKVATSASETPPSSATTATGEEVRHYVEVWEGIDTLDPINASRLAGLSNGASHTDTALTTDENNTINCYFHMGDADSWPLPPADYMMIDPPPVSDLNHMTALWQVQETSGTAMTPTMQLAKSVQGLMMQVALNTATDPQMPARIKHGSPATILIHPLYSGDTSGNYSDGDFNPASTISLTQINGVDYNYDAGATEFAGGFPPPLSYHRSTRFDIPSAGSANEHWGWGMANTQVNVSGKPIIAHFVPHSPGEEGGIDGVANGGIILGLFSDRAGTAGGRFWKVSGIDAQPVPALLQGVVFDIDDGPSQSIDDFGTFDETKIDGVYMGMLKAGALASRFRLSNCRALNTLVLVGGNVTRPCTFQTAIDALKASAVMSISNQSGASGLQYSSRQSVQIGDGSTKTYFKHDSASWEFAPLSNVNERRLNHSVSASSLELTLYGSANCTFALDNVVCGGPNDWKYTVHASHNAGATVTTVGHKVTGAEVTLQSAWVPTGAGTFDQCNEITHNGADLSTGFTITNGREVYDWEIAGATEAALDLLVAKTANCTIEDYHASSTYAGDINLDFDAMTLTVLNYTSTQSASELTAVMVNGSTVAGTAVADDESIVISNDVTFTRSFIDEAGNAVTGVNAGLILDSDSSTIDQVASAGPYSYTYTYASDRAATFRAFKPGYKQANESVTLGNVSASGTITLIAQAASQN